MEFYVLSVYQEKRRDSDLRTQVEVTSAEGWSTKFTLEWPTDVPAPMPGDTLRFVIERDGRSAEVRTALEIAGVEGGR